MTIFINDDRVCPICGAYENSNGYCKKDMKQYLPGVYYKRFGTKYLLDQNPNSDTVFAKAVRNGYKIRWVMECEPRFGEILRYQGKVYIDGVLMSEKEGVLFLLSNGKKQEVRK